MNDREKLFALMKEAVRNCDPGNTCLACRYRTRTDCMEQVTADHLIANGVVVREKGEWIDWAKRHGVVLFHHGIRSVGVVCSLCNKLSDNKYNFCPNCGADMRKGENDGV